MRLCMLALLVKSVLGYPSMVLDDCLLKGDTGSPSCFTKVVGTPKIVCNAKGIARVRGEYERIHIFCKSNRSMYFSYDGVEPTEGVFPVLKKLFNQTERTMAYSLELRIFGIRAQFKYYRTKFNKSSLLPKVYPRSGHYRVYNANNVTLSSSIYIFIEEPELIVPSFLKNSEMNIAELHNGSLIIPCKPSHYNSTVALWFNATKLSDTRNYTFLPNVGFISTFTKEGSYACLLYDGGSLVDTLEFGYPIANGSLNLPWGYEGMLPTSDNIDKGVSLKYETTKVDALTHVRLYCSNSVEKNNEMDMKLGIALSSGIVGALKLVKSFVSPKYYNLSYTVNLGYHDMRDEDDILIRETLPPKGIIVSACIYGKDYRAAQSALSLNGLIYTIGYSGNFRKVWDWSKAQNKWVIKLSVKQGYPTLYAGTEATFTCDMQTSAIVPPIFWYTGRANGSFVQEAVDDNVEDEIFHVVSRSVLTLNLTKDIQKVGCAATIFFNKAWKNATLGIQTVEGAAPEIVSPVGESTLTFNASAEKVVKCEARGIPAPFVYWGREGLNITGPTLNFSIAQIHGGNVVVKYTCTSYNIFGKHEAVVFVLNEEGDNMFGYLLGVISFFLLILVLGGILAYYQYVKHQSENRDTKLTKDELDDFFNGVVQNPGTQHPVICSTDVAEFHSCPYLEKYEIQKENLQIEYHQLLGEGEYGIVLKGYVNGNPVAVKTVRTHCDKRYVKALLSELKIMMYIGPHDNLIDLVAAYTKELVDGVVYLVTPLCELGCLQGYLRKNRCIFAMNSRFKGVIPKSVKDSGPVYENDVIETNLDANVISLDYIDLLKWAAQVASGMEYLEGKVIHGDLAVRNILLDSNKCAKITDFGLSRKMYGYADYVKKNSEPLPWRHMALESLRDLAFSSKSDCWAYGVTVWEIFSLAETPYPGYGYDIGFVRSLEEGLRMRNPKYLPEELYELVLVRCWNSDPSGRPSFGTLRQIFWEEICKVTGLPLEP